MLGQSDTKPDIIGEQKFRDEQINVSDSREDVQ
jgi:hypothetical protein